MKNKIRYGCSLMLLALFMGCSGNNETISVPQNTDNDIENMKKEFIVYVEDKLYEMEVFQNRLDSYNKPNLDCNSTNCETTRNQ